MNEFYELSDVVRANTVLLLWGVVHVAQEISQDKGIWAISDLWRVLFDR